MTAGLVHKCVILGCAILLLGAGCYASDTQEKIESLEYQIYLQDKRLKYAEDSISESQDQYYDLDARLSDVEEVADRADSNALNLCGQLDIC